MEGWDLLPMQQTDYQGRERTMASVQEVEEA